MMIQTEFNSLTLSQTSPCFYMSAVLVFLKHCGKRRNCLEESKICRFGKGSPYSKQSVFFTTLKQSGFVNTVGKGKNYVKERNHHFTFTKFFVCKCFQFGHGKGLTHYQTTNFRLFQTERICRQQFQI